MDNLEWYKGYSVVEGNQLSVLEAESLPYKCSAQTCELYSLNQALRFLKDREW
jgi:hypothetical protein